MKEQKVTITLNAGLAEAIGRYIANQAKVTQGQGFERWKAAAESDDPSKQAGAFLVLRRVLDIKRVGEPFELK